jgi:hypothetical protein
LTGEIRVSQPQMPHSVAGQVAESPLRRSALGFPAVGTSQWSPHRSVCVSPPVGAFGLPDGGRHRGMAGAGSRKAAKPPMTPITEPRLMVCHLHSIVGVLWIIQ